MDKEIVRTDAGAVPAGQFAGAAHAVRRGKSGPVILLCCLVLAVSVVLAAPLLMGGTMVVAATPQESSVQYYTARQPFPSPEAAAAALGFTPQVPAVLPEGYSADSAAVLDGIVFEQVYKNGKDEIVFRTAVGNDDLTFTDTVYQYSVTQETGGVSRTYEGGSDKKLNICVWGNKGYSYAFVVPDGIAADSMYQMAESVM